MENGFVYKTTKLSPRIVWKVYGDLCSSWCICTIRRV